MAKKQKLELTWIGKENRAKLEPRILLEDPSKSYHAKHRVTENDFYDNILIHGDNLLALKALEQEYAGKVKCIFIDPPYNTGSAFQHYDDGVEHSLWLSLMRDRLELLRRLLSEDGSLWITIDDNEVHYLKVLCDEIFGRSNFVANVVWQKRTSPDNRLRIGSAHDSILVYQKNKDDFLFNQLPMSAERRKAFKNPDNDPRGPWASTDCTAQGGHATPSQFYVLTTPAGRTIELPKSLCWRFTKKRMEEEIRAGRIWFGKDGKGVPRKKTYLSERKGQNAWTWWANNEVGHNQEAKKEVNVLFGADSPFDTPKPERLMQRILHLASNPGDLILDSFLGSGTTAAVAHKMGRRWVGIELGEHCHTHCIPRLKKVIDGEDLGGISITSKTAKSVKLCKTCSDSLCEKCQDEVGQNNKGGKRIWFGGGGFRYYTLAPSLLEKDQFGNWVISKEYNSAMLAQVMCKLEGFTYAPSEEYYWMQGHSTESDFIYVTTQTLTAAMLAKISEEVGENRSLLVCCSAFRIKPNKYPNLTVKKIPKAVMNKCEWGHDDYSLEIKNLPKAPPEPEVADEPKKRTQAERKKQATLFEV